MELLELSSLLFTVSTIYLEAGLLIHPFSKNYYLITSDAIHSLNNYKTKGNYISLLFIFTSILNSEHVPGYQTHFNGMLMSMSMLHTKTVPVELLEWPGLELHVASISSTDQTSMNGFEQTPLQLR